MEKVTGKLGLVALFLFSFFVFLYLSFPYGVLKEAIASQVQLATGMSVRIEQLGPAFPFGFTARDVELSGSGGAKVALKNVSIKLSILQFLLLRLGVSVGVEALDKGYIDLDIGFPLLKLVTGNVTLPSAVDLESKAFPLDNLVSYGLKHAAASGAAGPMGGPLLGALGFRGNLDGKASLSIDSDAVSQSTGDVRLTFSKAALILSDPSIGLPDQEFKTAQIKASMNGGSLKIDPASRFASDELELGIDGKVNVKNSFSASDLDLKLLVKLSGKLNDTFGFLMDGFSGGASKGGSLNLQIRGTVGSPVQTGM